MELKNKILSLAEKYYPEIIKIRNHLHSYPELSFQEYQTSEYIISQLTSLGIPFKTGYVKTGILAKLEAKNPSKRCIAIRADMDALPIKEKNEVSYRLLNEGVMHA